VAKKRTKKKPETVGDQLKRAIVDSGLTSYRIGKLTGLSPVAVDRFLSGERGDIRLSTINRLCEALELELGPKR